MLNYMRIYCQYLRDGPARPRGGRLPKIAKFPERAWLDQIFGLDISWIVAIALVVFMAVYLKRTKHGYEIAVVGESINTARYAGMNVNAVIMRTMFISGAIAGRRHASSFRRGNHAYPFDGYSERRRLYGLIVVWLAKLSPRYRRRCRANRHA